MHTRWSRRSVLKLAGLAVSTASAVRGSQPVVLFDGKTLNGWIQSENNAVSLSAAGILDPSAFVRKLMAGGDPVSAFLQTRLDGSLKAELLAYSPTADNAKAVIAALTKNVNQIIAGSSLSDSVRDRSMALRPETQKLLQANPHGLELARLNKLLLEDAFPAELARSAATGWIVKDGAMASTGSGRGVIYSAKNYDRFRLCFTMRHVSGDPDHQACVLIFCTRPMADETPLDALAGIQFQVPNGGHWDYRPGVNNNGGSEFIPVTKTQFNVHEWSRVEILADAVTGSARMAVAQPVGTRGVEVLRFRHAAAGRIGPIAWQMHNAGLFDEYKDVSLEEDPKEDELLLLR